MTEKVSSTARDADNDVLANGRSYAVPQQPVVVVCLDGFDPEYLDQGIADGVLPTLAAMQATGFVNTAMATLPTTTNANNTSIVTGVPPSVHGINGNFYLHPETGEEVMITGADELRCGTILAALERGGAKVAVVTAKDKLLKILQHELSGIAFSSENADDADLSRIGVQSGSELVGRQKPDRYSADLSLFALDAGLELLKRTRPDIIYLSTSDYVQHKHAPGAPEANAFYSAVDAKVAEMIALGATVAITADHGMADKSDENGKPNVVYVEDALNDRFGEGSVRVICPIADPFVRHHGSLGAFVRVHLLKPVDMQAMMAFVRELPGVELVLEKEKVCERFNLPIDREADFAVFSDRNSVLGARESDHDLSAVSDHRLRSHGGIGEQRVPFVVSSPLSPVYHERAAKGQLNNYDIFDAVLNGIV